jgi:hypothetical protein
MKKTQSKKTKKQKRVLATSILLAALIVGGGTFAWITAKDQVTNKLSASNKYGVTITETFTPPNQWTPGQEVEKKVGVLNTGNIGAFVKLNVVNNMDIIGLTSDTTFDSNNTASYVTLNKKDPDEVTAIQAGGELVFKAGTAVTETTDGTGFLPKTTGLYIFRREVIQETTEGDTDTYEYAGYYYVAASNDAGGQGTYYAVNVTSSSTATIVKKSASSSVAPTLDYSEVTTKNRIIAKYAGTNQDSDDDDIVIYINLDSTELANWTFDKDTGTFYYNGILASGASTGNLIKSVTLSEDTKSSAYEEFQYYLTVNIDSAQETSDTAKTTAVNAQDWDYEATVTTNEGKTTVSWTKKTTSGSSSNNGGTGAGDASDASTQATTAAVVDSSTSSEGGQ